MYKKIDVHAMYVMYRKQLHGKLVEYKKEIDSIQIDLGNIYKVLSNKEDSLEKCHVTLDDIQYTINNKCKLSSNKIGWSRLIDMSTKDELQYFIALAERRDTLNRIILFIEKCYHITENTYSRILRTFNFEMSKYILGSGYRFNIGRRVGSLLITEKARKVINNKTSIDWKESLNELEKIAKDKAPGLLSNYKHNLISKYKFIELMKKHVYSADERPNAPKWIIYHEEEYSYWWTWDKSQCNIRNQSLYSFVPSNYIHNKSRSQVDFVNSVSSKQEILDSTLIGPRDKLQALRRFDPNHHLIYRDVSES